LKRALGDPSDSGRKRKLLRPNPEHRFSAAHDDFNDFRKWLVDSGLEGKRYVADMHFLACRFPMSSLRSPSRLDSVIRASPLKDRHTHYGKALRKYHKFLATLDTHSKQDPDQEENFDPFDPNPNRNPNVVEEREETAETEESDATPSVCLFVSFCFFPH
jgi:hypothetical protein